jgi:hypothetical protein
MANASRKLDVITNVAVLCAALLVAVVAVKQYIITPPSAVPTNIKAGAKVSLRNVDWSARPKTLVLAVSDKCHFCSESAPFYQRLTRHLRDADVRIIAVLPQPVSDGVSYLQKLQVPITDVRQISFNTIPIGGTPTILLVNAKGIVEKTWLGKLDSKGESDVLKEAGCGAECD